MTDAHCDDVQARPLALVWLVLAACCRFLAVCAGIILILMALMSLASIVGRTLFGKPILGDYELVQMMSAIAISMALPFCQLTRGHIIVDFFTSSLPRSVSRCFDVVASLLLSGVAFVFSWRIGLGLLDLYRNGEASMLLNIPTWWGYTPMVPSFFLLGCTALYTAWSDTSRSIGRTRP